MRFQAMFKLVKCWGAPNIVRETVPSSWGCNDERTLAKLQIDARDEQSAMSTEQLTGVKDASRLKRLERKVR